MNPIYSTVKHWDGIKTIATLDCQTVLADEQEGILIVDNHTLFGNPHFFDTLIGYLANASFVYFTGSPRAAITLFTEMHSVASKFGKANPAHNYKPLASYVHEGNAIAFYYKGLLISLNATDESAGITVCFADECGEEIR